MLPPSEHVVIVKYIDVLLSLYLHYLFLAGIPSIYNWHEEGDLTFSTGEGTHHEHSTRREYAPCIHSCMYVSPFPRHLVLYQRTVPSVIFTRRYRAR